MKIQQRNLPFRPRRLRRNDNIRSLVRENRLSVDDLIMPVFVTAGENIKNEISSMPGIYQWSLDKLSEHIDELLEVGVIRVILFGIPAHKDGTGSDAINHSGIIQTTIRYLKEKFPSLYVITDVCMCEYTDHGHCGIIHDGEVHNDTTLDYLGRQVVSHAEAGVDMVAPSGMMDGMVGAIKDELDEAGFTHIPIMSYSVKYASAFYGPFREAAESVPQFGDRKSYQMDPANQREGMLEAELDIEEGADIIMVKPAMAYLDVVSHLRQLFDLPIACYNVSGEYSMVKAAAAKGWIDEEKIMMEMLLSMKRAGADIIFTYFAKDAASLLQQS